MTRIKYDNPDRATALEAKFEAQRIAFAPMVFQATLALRDLGILEEVFKARDAGIEASTVAAALDLSPYGVKVLLEAGLGAGLVRLQDERYSLTKTGYFILRDEMTRVNMDFVNDVCYQGMFYLQESVRDGKPAGLKTLGDVPKIYEILSTLPEKPRNSWFAFDHYYSDVSFPEVLPRIFKNKPAHILDVGGNTGKWALQCARYDKAVTVTIVDLPAQLVLAQNNICEAALQQRIHTHACDLLSEGACLPSGADVIWMSQFLDCFSEAQVIDILKLARDAMTPHSSLYIMELFWDRQRFEAAAFSLLNTSLYFTCLANGNSKMYHSKEMLACIDAAGLRLVDDIDDIGVSHTLLECKVA